MLNSSLWPQESGVYDKTKFDPEKLFKTFWIDAKGNRARICEIVPTDSTNSLTETDTEPKIGIKWCMKNFKFGCYKKTRWVDCFNSFCVWKAWPWWSFAEKIDHEKNSQSSLESEKQKGVNVYQSIVGLRDWGKLISDGKNSAWFHQFYFRNEFWKKLL